MNEQPEDLKFGSPAAISVATQSPMSTHSAIEALASSPYDIQRPRGDLEAEVHMVAATEPLSKLEIQTIFLSLSVVGFLAALDGTIIATAMPTIASSFDSLSQQSWLALSYLLTSTVFQPFFGRGTDLFGSKMMLFIAIGIFELGSILCALAENFIWLCCARALAGVGGAGLTVVVMVIISQLVPLSERGRYMGIMYARYAIALVAGPLLGGVFSDVNWRWCFWINPIISCPGLVVLLPFMKTIPNKAKSDVSWKDIDFFGIAMVAIFTGSLSLALNWGGTTYAWNSRVVIALLVVGCAMIPLFVLWELYIPAFPIIPMGTFKYRNVTSSVGNYFFTSSATYGLATFGPGYYQIVRHDSRIISGLELLPYVAPMLLASTLVGYLSSNTSKLRPFLWSGGLVNLIGTGLLIMLDDSVPRGAEYAFMIIAGLGVGFVLQTNTVSAQGQVGRELLASGTTMTMWSKSLGGIVGIAMQGAIIQNLFGTAILANADAAPYIAQLVAADKIGSLPADVQQVAAESYGLAFGKMMIVTTAFVALGFLFSLAAKGVTLKKAETESSGNIGSENERRDETGIRLRRVIPEQQRAADES